MNEVSTTNNTMAFLFEGNDVRVIIGEHGEPWFKASDVCKALCFGNARQALSSHVDSEDVRRIDTLTAGGIQSLNYVSESGVYSLIVGSRKPEAKRMKKWVTSEVLPSIRKTGGYTNRPMTQIEVLLASVQMLADVEKRQLEVEKQQQEVKQNLVAQKTKLLQIDNKITEGLEEVKATNLLTHCPSNAESITTIRERMNKEYGLSSAVVDTVMRQSLYAPKPCGMVRNQHESSGGSTYAVYWKKDISAVFKMFVQECKQVSANLYKHPFMEDKKFKIVK